MTAVNRSSTRFFVSAHKLVALWACLVWLFVPTTARAQLVFYTNGADTSQVNNYEWVPDVFQQRPSLPAGVDTLGRFAVGDLDADGSFEIVVSESTATLGRLRVFTYIAATRSYLDRGEFTFSNPNVNQGELAIGDLDGDQHDEVVLVPFGTTPPAPRPETGGSDSLFIVDFASVTPIQAQAFEIENQFITPITNVLVADVYGDAEVAELVLLTQNEGGLSNDSEALGSGTIFICAPQLGVTTGCPLVNSFFVDPSPTSARFPTSVAAGDLNGDGVKDLAIGYGSGCPGYFDQGVRVYESAFGGIEPPPLLPLLALIQQMTIADVDGDGMDELVAVLNGQGDGATIGAIATYHYNDSSLGPFFTQDLGILPLFDLTPGEFCFAGSHGPGVAFKPPTYVAATTPVDICNGADDDGDGEIDEDVPDTDADCDGDDDDCDGTADDDFTSDWCMALPTSHPSCPALSGTSSCTGGVAACTATDSDSDGSPDGADTDRDGLLDRWELYGIDWNCDGVLEVDFAPLRNAVGAAAGLADPAHKDLFLEIDVEQVMGGPNIALPAAEIQQMKDAFALSPVSNPDGTTGIRLWIDTPNGDPLGGGTVIPGIGISRLSGGDREYFGGSLSLDSCCYPNTDPNCATDPGADSTPGNLPAVQRYLDCRYHDTRARYFADPCCLPAAFQPPECAPLGGLGTGGYNCATQPRGVENSQFRFLFFRYGLEAFGGFENPTAIEDGIPGACNNGLDDSADGFADWLGAGALPPAPECANDPFGAELNGGLGSCSDGRDGDGVADRFDPDCGIDPFLREVDGLGGWAQEGSCTNGVDDNQAPGAERLTDVQDPDCMGLPAGELAARPWTCFDGLDNNGDGLFDGADPGCAGLPQEDGAGPGSCTNGIDDSSIGLPVPPTGVADFADGATDWDDPDCAALPREDLAGPNSCWDGVDNGDGRNNLDRTLDCYLFPTGEDGLADPQTCVDGIDNQADRVADALDADCWDFTVVPAVYQPNRDEDGLPSACGDGKDNSADGADENDLGDCPALPTENDTGAGSCFDGWDNHRDGLTDSSDPDCMGGTILNSEDGFANPAGLPPSCGDGIDNGNGAFDGADPDCAGQGFVYPIEGAMGTASSCTNGVDDDGNMVKDWDDCACNPRKPGCAGALGAPRLPAEDGLGVNSCFDFADNSSDGLDGSSHHGECTYWGGWGGHPRGFIDNAHNALTVMHEFGHNLGLDHGGPTKTNGMFTPGISINCKPPYLSIMNYSYGGIPQVYDPTRAEGPGAAALSCGDPLGADEDGADGPNEFDKDCMRGPNLLDFAPPRYPDPTQPSGFGRGKDLSELGLDEAAPREDLIWDPADTSNAFIFVFPDRFLPGRSESGWLPDGSCGDPMNVDEDGDLVANTNDPQCYGGVEWRMPVNGYNYLLSEDPMNPVQGGNCGNNVNDDADMASDAADPDCYGYDFDASGSITQGAPIAAINLNNGPNSLCYNGALETLNGPNDWENLAYATYGPNSPRRVELVPDPPFYPDVIRRNQLLTDVSLDLVPEPEVVVMNERADFVATLSNNGPGLVASARLKLTLTEGLGFGALPAGCEVSGATALCLFGRLLPGFEIAINFTIVPTSNPSGEPRFLRAEAIGQGNEEVAPWNNAVDVRIIAESDLELVDVVPEVESLTVLMGDTVAFEVDTDVVSHGPSNPVDSEIAFVVTAPPGVTVTPDESPVLVPDLNVDLRTVTTSFTVECQKMGVYEIELESTIMSAGLVYDDPDLTNNTDSTSFVVRCVPCVHATDRFVQADGTTVTSAQVHGGTYFELGANYSRVNGDVFVAGNAFLRSTAIVDGDLTLSGQIQTQGPYQITGTASPFSSVAVLPIESHTITTGTQDRTVPVNGNATWAPGSYDDGFVGSFGTATLSAGTYNFRTFEVNVDGRLNLDTSGGDIIINAQTLLKFGDRSTVLPSGTGSVSFYTNATSANMVRIGTDVKFRASLTAPTGTVHAYSRTYIDGCVAGRIIQLEPNITLGQPSLGGACNVNTYEAESITHSTGSAITGGWNLHSNGYVATTHDFTPGAATLWITAKGQQGGGVWPRMRVRVGGVQVYERFVNTTAWTTYQVPITAAGGPTEIRIVFDNDFNGGPGNDRNLHLDKIFVDCTPVPP